MLLRELSAVFGPGSGSISGLGFRVRIYSLGSEWVDRESGSVSKAFALWTHMLLKAEGATPSAAQLGIMLVLCEEAVQKAHECACAQVCIQISALLLCFRKEAEQWVCARACLVCARDV